MNQQHDAGEFFSLLMEALKPVRDAGSLKQSRLRLDPKDIEAMWKPEVGPRLSGGASRLRQRGVLPLSDGKQRGQRRTRNPFLGHEAHAPIRCEGCGPLSDAKYTEFMHLILDIKQGDSLKDSLKRYTETVRVKDYRCEKCDKEIEIKKRSLLGQLPKALCLQLQLAGGDTFKIDAFVKFPNILDLGPYSVSSNAVDFFGSVGSGYPTPPFGLTPSVSSDSLNEDPELVRMSREMGFAAMGRSKSSLVGGAPGLHDGHEVDPMERSVSPGLPKEEAYQLCAVVVHLGRGVGAGHFICYRKDGESWFCANDETVYRVEESRVFSSHVYMLFYEKT